MYLLLRRTVLRNSKNTKRNISKMKTVANFVAMKTTEQINK